MPNPYGITEVNVPGILSAFQEAQGNRIRNMQLRMQMEQQQRQQEQRQGIRAIIAREAARGMSSGASGQPRAAAQPSGGMAELMSSFGNPDVSMATAQPPAAPPAQPQQQSRINPQALFAELVAAGSEPTEARQIVQSLSGMDERGLDAVRTRYQTLAPLYIAAAQLPYEQRRAYINSVRGQLNELGLTDEQIDSFDPTDQNLNSHISLGTPVAAALEASRPAYRNVDGVVIDERRIGRGNPVVYESPFINVGGSLYARPGASQGAPQEQTATNPQTGERIRLNPQTGQWEPIVQGGPQASPSADNF